MIRSLLNQRLPPLWICLGLLVMFNIAVFDLSGWQPDSPERWALFLMGEFIVLGVMGLFGLLMLDCGVPWANQLYGSNLRLYLVSPTFPEIEAMLQGLVGVGVLVAREGTSGGTLYVTPGCDTATIPYMYEVALVDADGIRWLSEANEVSSSKLWCEGGPVPFRPFRLRLPRRPCDLDFEQGGEATRTTLSTLERLGVVSLQQELGGTRLFGVSERYDVGNPAYATNSVPWWHTLGRRRIYLKARTAVSFSPLAPAGLLYAEFRYNRHIENLVRYHAFATQIPLTISVRDTLSGEEAREG